MESVKSARARLGSYPLHLASCAPEAANYGRCDQPNIAEISGIKIRVKMTCALTSYIQGAWGSSWARWPSTSAPRSGVSS